MTVARTYEGNNDLASIISQTTVFDVANRPTSSSATIGGATTVFTYAYSASSRMVQGRHSRRQVR